MINNKRKAKRVKRRAAREGGKATGSRPSFPLTFPKRQLPTMNPWPEETDTTLEWTLFTGILNAGQTELNIRWYTNAAMSPDIVTPANRSVGFTQWITMYRFSRVIAYQARVTIANRESYPINCLFRNTNIDPGTGTGQFAYAGESFSKFFTVSGTAGGPTVKTISMAHKICDIVGQDIEYDDTYKTTNTTQAPTNLTFLGFSAKSADGTSTWTVGCTISITIKLKVRFTERELANDTIRNSHNCQMITGTPSGYKAVIHH